MGVASRDYGVAGDGCETPGRNGAARVAYMRIRDAGRRHG